MTTSDIQLPGIDKLAALAQTYFDAAHDMDADKFASIFHEAAFVTRRGENDTVVVTPVAAWLDTVRMLKPPREAGAERKDQILSINLVRDMALLKISLRIPPREVTDLLSCFFLNGRWQIVQKVFNAEPLR
ncbi:nuclear transport factor 2 family protein [Mesorhizobium sp. WSM4303]|uniref:nuclear transport factor 2 family protein n=1 Tax=unclassified Mesorhizobium TaxID=325217 RepID=UPI00115CE639|nr:MULTISPECIES: nuclear transport factor 2 family protein [unclassified Mesorhizobium]TRC95804.1 nuclear transport factor 2 family protein [Mesorhizobium sp. WSM4306]TRD04480.1 nuclear transport factor 2 family protein [Mesorhizobium sp. WSM4303]